MQRSLAQGGAPLMITAVLRGYPFMQAYPRLRELQRELGENEPIELTREEIVAFANAPLIATVVTVDAAELRQLQGGDFPNTILGAGQVTIYPRVCGASAWLDSFVRDSRYRGQRIGDQLMEHALQLCHEHAVRTGRVLEVHTMCKPRRRDAIQMIYRHHFERISTGYAQTETNLFRRLVH